MSNSANGSVETPGRNVGAKSGLNRSILDQGWSMFATMLRYKLAQRGGQLLEVDPAYTSQTYAECGSIDQANRPDQATVACVSCGHTDNAEVNAARNIHQARTLAVEPPKRTLRRVGKRKHSGRHHLSPHEKAPSSSRVEHVTRAHDRKTWCHLIADMIVALGVTFLAETWEEPDPREERFNGR